MEIREVYQPGDVVNVKKALRRDDIGDAERILEEVIRPPIREDDVKGGINYLKTQREGWRAVAHAYRDKLMELGRKLSQ